MVFIKTVVVFFILILALLGLLPIGLTAFVLSFFGLKKPMAQVIYRSAQGWAKLMIFLTRCPLTVRGRENIPKNEGVCIVSNHVGIFDIVLALATIGRPFGFIAKKELLLVPFLNIWVWLLGGLFIDRKSPKKALHTINVGIKRIKQGGGMIIFPEGTRSKGRGLQPFRSGSFKLATQAGAIIVPMAITGSYDVFEKTHLIRKVPINIVFGEPIPTAHLPHEEKKQVLSDKVHGVIAASLDRIALESSPGIGQAD